MESNYVKSARIKLERLGVKDCKDISRHKQEIFDIIYDYFCKECQRQIVEAVPTPVHPTKGYMTFVDGREITMQPDLKPWQIQTLDYYTRKPQIERIKLK
jgi:hypothetical protein